MGINGDYCWGVGVMVGGQWWRRGWRMVLKKGVNESELVFMNESRKSRKKIIWTLSNNLWSSNWMETINQSKLWNKSRSRTKVGDDMGRWRHWAHAGRCAPEARPRRLRVCVSERVFLNESARVLCFVCLCCWPAVFTEDSSAVKAAKKSELSSAERCVNRPLFARIFHVKRALTKQLCFENSQRPSLQLVLPRQSYFLFVCKHRPVLVTSANIPPLWRWKTQLGGKVAKQKINQKRLCSMDIVMASSPSHIITACAESKLEIDRRWTHFLIFQVNFFEFEAKSFPPKPYVPLWKGKLAPAQPAWPSKIIRNTAAGKLLGAAGQRQKCVCGQQTFTTWMRWRRRLSMALMSSFSIRKEEGGERDSRTSNREESGEEKQKKSTTTSKARWEGEQQPKRHTRQRRLVARRDPQSTNSLVLDNCHSWTVSTTTLTSKAQDATEKQTAKNQEKRPSNWTRLNGRERAGGGGVRGRLRIFDMKKQFIPFVSWRWMAEWRERERKNSLAEMGCGRRQQPPMWRTACWAAVADDDGGGDDLVLLLPPRSCVWCVFGTIITTGRTAARIGATWW